MRAVKLYTPAIMALLEGNEFITFYQKTKQSSIVVQ